MQNIKQQLYAIANQSGKKTSMMMLNYAAYLQVFNGESSKVL